MAALDQGIELALGGQVDALVTAPLNKALIASHECPGFLGHTDYLAAACGGGRYGRDYLMAFLSPSLNVALLSTPLPLRQALDGISQESVLDALQCMGRSTRGRIAVAGLNPHAGEGGLMGREELDLLLPAIAAAQRAGIDAHGPESPDTIFARAHKGEFDWVLALYHDQGLIAVKTAAFGEATNWTMGLPILRTSVDHGTAYDIDGKGLADVSSLRAVIETTLHLVQEQRA
jgi:4-hydroxythreonine-4-phosphate dehydrogenase